MGYLSPHQQKILTTLNYIFIQWKLSLFPSSSCCKAWTLIFCTKKHSWPYTPQGSSSFTFQCHIRVTVAVCMWVSVNECRPPRQKDGRSIWMKSSFVEEVCPGGNTIRAPELGGSSGARVRKCAHLEWRSVRLRANVSNKTSRII